MSVPDAETMDGTSLRRPDGSNYEIVGQEHLRDVTQMVYKWIPTRITPPWATYTCINGRIPQTLGNGDLGYDRLYMCMTKPNQVALKYKQGASGYMCIDKRIR